MTNTNDPGLLPRANLTDDETRAVRELRDLCNAQEGLELKLALGPWPTASGETANAFLAYADGRLAGYVGLDGQSDVEICGMVHPDARRRGLGRALLAAARAECRRRSAREVLLICETGSPAGQRFVAAAGLPNAFGEHHMVLGTLAPPRPGDARLQLHRAGPADLETLVQISAAAFDDPPAERRATIAQDLQDPNQPFYMARLDAEPVGSLKVALWEGGAGIYGFGVLPAYRGRGLGRQILTTICTQLLAAGRTPISLEVETENAPAFALYRSSGFRVTTTYGYYVVAL